MDSVRLTIDGLEVTAPSTATVLEAAQQAGIFIPTLCADPDLEPYGGCRLCVVEIDKRRGLPTACNTQVAEGMVVHTETPAVTRVRRTVVELLMAEHHADCLVCPKDGHCSLQSAAAHLGVRRHLYAPADRKLPIDDSNPFFYFDPNQCVFCAKCVRTCDEIVGVGAISFMWRGYDSRVATFAGRPIIESTCVSCGECVVRCPVNALVPKVVVQPTREVKSVCVYCGVGCGIYLGVRGEKVVSVRGDRESPANRGRLCVKGRFGVVDFLNHPDRLTTPLIKRDGQFVKATWDEALELVASRLSEYKGDQFVAIASAKTANEDNYLLQKFARAVMGTNNVDHCARLCHSPTVVGLATSFGSGAMTNSNAEIAGAACILAIGTNTTVGHPIIGLEVKRAVRRGAKLIVVNPKEIELCRHATIWLRLRPGTNIPLLLGMMKVILDEGLADEAFIRERCEGFDALKESLASTTLEGVSAVTGVPAKDIAAAARIYAQNSPASILFAMGVTQHTHGTDNVLALADLAMLTGNVGKPSSGVNPLRGQNNVQGACDMGCLPNFYPGYQRVDNDAAREKFQRAWGGSLSDKPGLTLMEMFDAAHEGYVKAAYLMGENPVLSDANASHVEEALKRLDFLVVQDIFMSETARLADVVLPVASFAERDGTFTNTERRVQRVRRAVAPPGDARPDWWIVCQVARRMEAKGFDFHGPSEVMDEIASLTPSYGGISYPRLERGGLQWPCPTSEHPGTPILHIGRFPTPNGKGYFKAVKYAPPAELPDAEYPLLLTTDRSLFHYHTGTMTRKVKGLNVLRKEELLELSHEDAERLGIADGETVRVVSRRGEVVATARVNGGCPPGVVSMTFHFAEAPTNVLTSPARDPVAGIPETKVCAVRVEKTNVA